MNLQRIARLVDNDNYLVINEAILTKAQKNNQIIYGAKAYNSQSPDYLKKQTIDYDILTKRPKKSAKELAKELSRRLGKKVEVVKGTHKGTYRVKLNNQVIADYTQLKSRPSTKRYYGNEYRSLKSIKRNARRLSNNPKLSYRKEKDLDTLDRIKEIERINSFFDT